MMRGNKLAWVSAAFLCTACGVSNKATTKPNTAASAPAASEQSTAAASNHDIPEVTPEELTAAPGHLALGEITLLTNGKPGLVLHPDGSIELPDQKKIVGHLDRDGTFTDPTGITKIRFREDGELTLGDSDDKFVPVIIEKDGTMKFLKEDIVFRVLPDGTVTGTSPNAAKIKVVGANEKTRRTAMFLLLLVTYPIQE